MIHTPDKKLRGHAMAFESLEEIIATSEKCAGPGYKRIIKEKIRTGTAVTDEMVNNVRTMITALQNADLPVAKSRKRKPKWNEVFGDLEVERFLDGDPFTYRNVERQLVKGPGNVVMLCNVDANAWQTGLEWRAAIAAALTDILEENGYNVEIWSWTNGYSVYQRPISGQFTTYKYKAGGMPLDIRSMLLAMASREFLTSVIFESFKCIPGYRSWGGADYDLGEWRKYMDITKDDVVELKIPIVWKEKDAIKCTKELLEKVINTQHTGTEEDVNKVEVKGHEYDSQKPWWAS